MLQSKDLDRLNGYKNKTYKYAAYKRHTSDQRHAETDSDSMENIFHANVNQKKLEYQYLYQIE